MKQKANLVIITFFLCNFVVAQGSLPLIKATSKLVDIRDGNEMRKGYWTITPDARPDIYTPIFSKKQKRITFYTDIDSISFDVKPNQYISFNILFNKDTALTGIFLNDTLGTLKKAGKYNLTEKHNLPKFTYQSSNDPHLAELRKGFNLDSIAGFGNELSRVLNLLHWIHNLIPHDGNHSNPDVMNAMNMIAVCKKDNRGLNCRGLATVLNECYLAMGIPSRFVTCLPKDSMHIDNDCHVINMVYVSALKKWIWIDPTFDAYVMNEKGALLSIEEVRERIINDKPLIINPEANWNHKVSQTKEYYLYSYMAKNLYLLQCPVRSEFDTETRQPGKSISYIELAPLDYFKRSLDRSESTNNNNKTTFVNYRTNDPNWFWQKPE